MFNKDYWASEILRIAYEGDCLAIRNNCPEGCLEKEGCGNCIRKTKDGEDCDVDSLTDWLYETYIPKLTVAQEQELEYMLANGYNILSCFQQTDSDIYDWYALNYTKTRYKECELSYCGLDLDTDYSIRDLLGGKIVIVEKENAF